MPWYPKMFSPYYPCKGLTGKSLKKMMDNKAKISSEKYRSRR